uniref:Uncharacterized protein LOC111109032 n=1 Tax=Crassostrea virginica TaxID=6565 RepID=A0A8B8BDH6_CRAVI|nr:uncharacterized protein LOC111109032 [Crassostrea virginica]
MCTALQHIQVNKAAHLLESALPPRVRLVVTLHGPKQSTPTYVNGGEGFSRIAANDETPGLSTEDRHFIELMNREFKRDVNGKWTAALPFCSNRPVLPNNHSQAMRRARILDSSLKKNPTKLGHALEFMKNIFDRNHAEVAPPLKPNEECWYLPIFGVYHPLKPEKIRMVFDSSARFQDLSLNSVLLSGPDLTNSLIGVLMRFRMETVAVVADIEQMFYCFGVAEKHRNFLRFLWYTNNDPTKPLIEYRMTVQVFGNTPSPAVATYGFRLAAIQAENNFGKDVREFVERNFYVDDGLVSLPTTQEARDLIGRTKEALMIHGNLRLHKIASNDPIVMQSFDVKDLVKDLIDLDVAHDDLPTQRSLGLVWDLQKDAFGFELNRKEKPYTRRGVLSCVNSLYDPLGFIAPITIQGKLLLREMTQTPHVDWDAPLPEEFLLKEKTVLIFTDASEVAIAAVAYLFDSHGGEVNLGFIMGKSKVAPKPATSIPRLELCAAVLGVEIATIIRDQLDIGPDCFKFYIDSRIVLGYVYNRTRRLLTYVSNRVQKILNFSRSSQWNFIPTDQNPADHGTKPTVDSALYDSWLRGPIEWLSKEGTTPHHDYDLVDPATDLEIKQDIVVCKRETSTALSWTLRYEKFSSWKNLVRAIMCLRRVIRNWANRKDNDCKNDDGSEYRKAEMLIIQHVQSEVYQQEIPAVKCGKPLPKSSSILRLNPVLDEEGIICVGGRLQRSDFDWFLFPLVNFTPKDIIFYKFLFYDGYLTLQHHKERIEAQGYSLQLTVEPKAIQKIVCKSTGQPGGSLSSVDRSPGSPRKCLCVVQDQDIPPTASVYLSGCTCIECIRPGCANLTFVISITDRASLCLNVWRQDVTSSDRIVVLQETGCDII